MAGVAMAALGERQAISEVLRIFSGLFDGPPPPAVAEVLLHDTIPALQRIWDCPPHDHGAQIGDFEKEYEALFLIPTHDHISPYISHHQQKGERSRDGLVADLAALAAAMGIPWRKDTFVPGRAFPVSPDHISVAIGMAAILLVAGEEGASHAQRAAFWVREILVACAGALSDMREYIQALERPPRAYGAVVELAAAYLERCLREEVWEIREDDALSA